MHPGFSQRLAEIQARMARAAARVGRDPAAVRLVGASKTVAADRVVQAFQSGLLEFGENRVQEAEAKIAEVDALLGQPPAVRPVWHLIGHLQGNKAKRAVALFDCIESVDSERLAEALQRHAEALDRRLEVLVEVNTSGEAAKAGVAPDEAVTLVRAVVAYPRLIVRGLMTVGPLVESPDLARPAYRRLAGLLAEAGAACPGARIDQLSMGMSGDFEVAIEEGATIVRVGTALFGSRTAGGAA